MAILLVLILSPSIFINDKVPPCTFLNVNRTESHKFIVTMNIFYAPNNSITNEVMKHVRVKNIKLGMFLVEVRQQEPH